MVYKTAVVITVLLLSVTLAQVPRGKRCRCTSHIKELNVKKVIQLEIFPSSPKCDKEEYVVVLKNSKKPSKMAPSKKCVSPNIRAVKSILKGKNKKLKHIKVIRHRAALGN